MHEIHESAWPTLLTIISCKLIPIANHQSLQRLLHSLHIHDGLCPTVILALLDRDNHTHNRKQTHSDEKAFYTSIIAKVNNNRKLDYTHFRTHFFLGGGALQRFSHCYKTIT